jgi:hypothetical protein
MQSYSANAAGRRWWLDKQQVQTSVQLSQNGN